MQPEVCMARGAFRKCGSKDVLKFDALVDHGSGELCRFLPARAGARADECWSVGDLRPRCCCRSTRRALGASRKHLKPFTKSFIGARAMGHLFPESETRLQIRTIHEEALQTVRQAREECRGVPPVQHGAPDHSPAGVSGPVWR